MKYHNITHDDMTNGDGLRVVLWVSGCEHRCPGCQNPITWDPADGLTFNTQEREEIFNALEKPYIAGITFSGGDPLLMVNRGVVYGLMRQIKEKFPDALLIFVMPPSFRELERRLTGRGTESREEIQGRLAAARREMAMAPRYDYILVNDDVAGAAGRLAGLIQAGNWVPARCGELLRGFLEEE